MASGAVRTGSTTLCWGVAAAAAAAAVALGCGVVGSCGDCGVVGAEDTGADTARFENAAGVRLTYVVHKFNLDERSRKNPIFMSRTCDRNAGFPAAAGDPTPPP